MSYYDEICSRERFAKDTAEHKIQVIRDDGVYRHLRFKRTNSNAYYFDLVTWPVNQRPIVSRCQRPNFSSCSG